MKAAGPDNHQLSREITGHLRFTAPWLSERRVGHLLRHKRDLNVLVLEYLSGVRLNRTVASVGEDRPADRISSRLVLEDQ